MFRFCDNHVTVATRPFTYLFDITWVCD